MRSKSSSALLEDSIRQLNHQIPELISRYIRIDTSNPPGDVSAAADFVEELLASESIETKRLGPSSDRANVVGTIDGEDRPFILSHHMDVVPAPVNGWSVDPFGGTISDGFVWGRGALDMKGFGILSVLCAVALKRAGLPLRRGVRIVATADEEIGGTGGAKWLVDKRFDEVSGEFLLTEGGYGNIRRRFAYYRVQTAEKGVSTVRLVARGRPGHASSPRSDNPVVRVSRALARISDYRSPIGPRGAKDFGVRFIEAFPPSLIGIDSAKPGDMGAEELEKLISRIERRRSTNIMRNTFTPTIVQGGFGQNVIPAVCEAFIDCRSLPGVSGKQLLVELEGVIDDPEVELELIKASVGTQSDEETELMDAIRVAVQAERPGALVVPYLTSGGSDAKHFRAKGVTCYGLIPFEFETESEVARIHGLDERVSLENLERGFRVLLRIVSSMCL